MRSNKKKSRWKIQTKEYITKLWRLFDRVCRKRKKNDNKSEAKKKKKWQSYWACTYKKEKKKDEVEKQRGKNRSKRENFIKGWIVGDRELEW